MTITFVSELLNEWGIPENIINTFTVNEIDKDSLLELTPELAAELIPLVGPRIKFLKCVRLWQECEAEKKKQTQSADLGKEPTTPKAVNKENNSAVLNRCEKEGNGEHGKLQVEDVVKENDDLGVLTPDREISNVDLHLTVTPTTSDADSPIPVKRRCIEPNTSKKALPPAVNSSEKVRDILNQTSDGAFVLATYAADGALNELGRNKLVKCILNHLLKDNQDRRISRDQFDLLSKEIVEIFPNENVDVYFTTRTLKKNNKIRTVCGGKLWYKYFGLRKTFKTCQLIDKSVEKTEDDKSDDDSSLFDADHQDLIQWLKNSKAPWVEVLGNWKITAQKRIHELQDNPGEVHEYVSKFPALQDEKGYTLLDLDFKFLYPDSHFNLFGAWRQFSSKLVDCFKAKFPGKFPIKDVQDCSDEVNTAAIILRWIPKLLPPSTIVKSKKQQWRPSQIESQDAFLLHVKTVGDIQPALEARREKLVNFGLKLQPQAILVGKTIQSIDTAYVSIDEYLYDVGTPLKAVDTTFKAFQALHAEYPPEAAPTWLFLQQYIYNIYTKFDQKFISVSTLMSEFKK